MTTVREQTLWTLKITNWLLLSDSLRITLLTVLCELCVFVLTCFSHRMQLHTKATQTHSSLMLISFHFSASLPITVIPNKETQRMSDVECIGGEKKTEKRAVVR